MTFHVNTVATIDLQMMRTTAVMLGLGMFVLGYVAGCNQQETDAPGSTSSQDQATYARGDSLTVTGTVIDTRCYATNEDNVTNDHEIEEDDPWGRPDGRVENCGTICARQGFPVAILENGQKGGKVWVLVTVPQMMADYMAQTVRVRGVVRSEGAVIPERIELKTEEGWVFIL